MKGEKFPCEVIHISSTLHTRSCARTLPHVASVIEGVWLRRDTYQKVITSSIHVRLDEMALCTVFVTSDVLTCFHVLLRQYSVRPNAYTSENLWHLEMITRFGNLTDVVCVSPAMFHIDHLPVRKVTTRSMPASPIIFPSPSLTGAPNNAYAHDFVVYILHSLYYSTLMLQNKQQGDTSSAGTYTIHKDVYT